MAVITIFKGSYCNSEQVIHEIIRRTGYKCITENDIIKKASKLSGIQETGFNKIFSSDTSVFNQFTYEKEQSVAYLKLALSEFLSVDHRILVGFPVHLIPDTVKHVLRICLISDLPARVSNARGNKRCSETEAEDFIRTYDINCSRWVHLETGYNDPWDSDLYDIVIPTDKLSVGDTADLITEKSQSNVVTCTDNSRKAVQDFRLASLVELALIREGHHVHVVAMDGEVRLIIRNKILMMQEFRQDILTIARQVPGVRSVRSEIDNQDSQSSVIHKYKLKFPSKVLLVDDEREFVHTLSERLILKDMDSTIAYDGKSALHIVDEDKPEVMILDLKMPGIDGVEVLRQVKKKNPHIEVIILTGHESDEDKDLCMKLGAFAYLQKPVDVDILSETLKKANENISKKMI